MDPRSESLNGKHPNKETKSIMAEALGSAGHLVDQVKSKAAAMQRQASNYIDVTDDYAKEHPWRVALTAAGIGVLAGAFFFRRKK